MARPDRSPRQVPAFLLAVAVHRLPAVRGDRGPALGARHRGAGLPAAVGPLALLAGVPLAVVERWRLRLVDPAPLRSPHHPPAQPGVWAWLGTRFR
ncbi:MAG TPA: sensor domain-containing protein, partial [Actinomycetes bacterium]|nr:sensor domain-containing protein [Actinomycetes bacterium]